MCIYLSPEDFLPIFYGGLVSVHSITKVIDELPSEVGKGHGKDAVDNQSDDGTLSINLLDYNMMWFDSVQYNQRRASYQPANVE